jgi:hypothetical protein
MLEFSDGTIVSYYFVDFNIRFKQQVSIDFDAMVDTLNGSLFSYFETGDGKDELLDMIISYEQLLQRYLEENRGDCEDIMSDWFSASEYLGEEKTVTWEAMIYNGDNMNMMVNIHTCSDCDWPWVGIGIWPEFFGPYYMEEEPYTQPDREQYRGMTTEQLYSALEDGIGNAVSAARTMDAGGSVDLNQITMDIMAVNDVLNEKLYDKVGESTRQERFRQRMNHLERVLLQYASSIYKEERRQSRYEKPLLVNWTLHEEKWCRHINDIWCEPGYSCYEAECVSAYGGDEDCNNGDDDDNDNKIDCEDPDCEEDEYCLCRRADCDMWPHRECHIVSGSSRSGGDIISISASKDEDYLYIMLDLSGSPRPSTVAYGFHVWTEEQD